MSHSEPKPDDHPAGQRLAGNPMALAGAIIYLLEWVAILGFGAGQVPSATGTSAAGIAQEYSQHATAIALMAGWFTLVLPGRVLFVAGIRHALSRSCGGSAVADFAVGAMVVSVVVEVSSYLVAAGVGYAATLHADQQSLVTGDAVANLLNLGLYSGLGLSVVSLSFVMLRSHLFFAWLCWLGLVAGAAGCVLGVTAGAAFVSGGTLLQASGALSAIAALGFWAWMLITGVILFRAGRKQT